MKQIMIILGLLLTKMLCQGQKMVNDESLRYQQQRMVYLQWDQNKFTPKPGFLSLNPYYWLTWGLFHPGYHKKDLRPLSANGPQTQRLALVAAMSSTDKKYKLQSDTIRNTAQSEIVNQTGLLSDADPLWQLYYADQLKSVMNASPSSILSGQPPEVSQRLVDEGLFDWYQNELSMLKERINGSRSATLDRGARIMAYHRCLMQYRQLAGVWSIRTSSAQAAINMTKQQQKVRTGQVTVSNWAPDTDIRIAKQVLQHIQ